ncbi:MAG: PD-(D/E)XK nuclease domain-containing protein, partial [Oscillospiraceae bacterium]|nr:PD-(D/E)XK nuclease domain-containing protein [Oscillospiraceae bacterium]
IEDGGWEFLVEAIKVSDRLLNATLTGDSDTVAKMIEKAHSENASILKYNDENALACVISIAYYSARKKYIMHRELATGKGFADIVFIPRKNIDSPAIVVELKHNQSAETAISQIKAKRYTEKIAQYTGDIVLVGINYDEQKGHSCIIETVSK